MRDIEVKIDEKTLQTIANLTDGKYFRATNNLKLAEIYKEIDRLEKSKIDSKELSSKTEEYKGMLFRPCFWPFSSCFFS